MSKQGSANLGVRGTTWIYEEGAFRKATREELRRIGAPRGTLEVGDEVLLKLPAEYFDKVVNGGNEIADEFAKLLGRVSMQWAYAADRVLDIFVVASGMRETVARTVFDGIRNDRTQRTITLEVAKLTVNDGALVDALRKELRLLDVLAGQRNAFAHLSFSIHRDDNWDGKMNPTRIDRPFEGGDAAAVAAALADSLEDCESKLLRLLIQIRLALRA